jgi:PAS domain S-box-containing protein
MHRIMGSYNLVLVILSILTGIVASYSTINFFERIRLFQGKCTIEKDLQDREDRFHQLAENINLVLWMREIATNQLLYVSPAYEEIWGRAYESLYDSPFSCLETIHHDDYARVLTYLSDLKTGMSKQEDYRIRKPNGSIRWIREHGFPIYNQMGEVYRIAGISEDVTAMKNKEELLQKRNKLMVISNLAAGIAHEIRNPLTTIKGFMNLLKSEINLNYQEIISSELQSIEYVINEFLMLADPKQDMQFQYVDVHSLIQKASEDCNYIISENHVEFQLKYYTSLPLIECDEKQIYKVFENVIKNAIEAMPYGGTIQIETGMMDCDHVFIRIKDNGIGIPHERLKKIGEPFYSNKERGIGLGLMVCFKAIENHNGNIFIESEVNKGTVVNIILPIVSQYSK